MSTDHLGNLDETLESPATRAFLITPHDTNQLAYLPRGIYVGTSGDIALIAENDTVSVILKSVPAGVILPIRAHTVLNTGTVATNLIGLS